MNNLTNSFLARVFEGTHDFENDTIKAALYTTSQNTGKSTYNTTDEASGTGYTAGGETLTCTLGGDNDGRTATFDDVSWTGSFAFKSVLIYNATQSNRTIASLSIGNDTLTITNQIITLRLSAMPITAVRSEA